MSTETITIDEAEDILYGAPVATQMVSEHRWYDKLLVVFRGNGDGMWGFYYLKPKTEMQDGQDRFEADPVPVFPVYGRETILTVYQTEPVNPEAHVAAS